MRNWRNRLNESWQIVRSRQMIGTRDGAIFRCCIEKDRMTFEEVAGLWNEATHCIEYMIECTTAAVVGTRPLLWNAECRIGGNDWMKVGRSRGRGGWSESEMACLVLEWLVFAITRSCRFFGGRDSWSEVAHPVKVESKSLISFDFIQLCESHLIVNCPKCRDVALNRNDFLLFGRCRRSAEMCQSKHDKIEWQSLNSRAALLWGISAGNTRFRFRDGPLWWKFGFDVSTFLSVCSEWLMHRPA
jgi:hypothetical protein